MKTLEKDIINRLNKFLSKYHLVIATININNSVLYYLDDTMFVICMGSWGSIDEMLFDYSYSLFYRLKKYYEEILYYSNMHKGIELERYKRYAVTYDNIKYLENSNCLEEFAMKMDLMGI